MLRIQETLESLVGAGKFSCWDLKLGKLKWRRHLNSIPPLPLAIWGSLNVITCLLGYAMSSHIPEANEKLPQQVESHLLPHLFG